MTYDSNIVSDLHKDAFGFRPSRDWWIEWNEAGVDAKQIIWDDLLADLADSNAREVEEQTHAAIAFEQQIAEIRELMNNTREDAIRVIIQAEDEERNVEFYGYESLEFSLGLKYGYIKGSL